MCLTLQSHRNWLWQADFTQYEQAFNLLFSFITRFTSYESYSYSTSRCAREHNVVFGGDKLLMGCEYERCVLCLLKRKKSACGLLWRPADSVTSLFTMERLGNPCTVAPSRSSVRVLRHCWRCFGYRYGGANIYELAVEFTILDPCYENMSDTWKLFRIKQRLKQAWMKTDQAGEADSPKGKGRRTWKSEVTFISLQKLSSKIWSVNLVSQSRTSGRDCSLWWEKQ